MIDTSRTLPHSKMFTAQTRGSGAPLLPSAFGRGLRSVVTALIALSLGVALVSWLKAGSDDTRPAAADADPQATSNPRARAAVWAHRRRHDGDRRRDGDRRSDKEPAPQER